MKTKIRIVAMILAVCMIGLSLTSCMDLFFILLKGGYGSVDFDADWKEFTLTEEEVDCFYEQLESCERLILENAGTRKIENALEELLVQFYHINTQAQIAYFLYSMNERDGHRSEDYLFASEASTDAYAAYMKMCRTVYASDCDYRDTFFATWDESDLKRMETYTDQIAKLERENNEIVVAYRDLSDKELESEIYGLFSELIQNNNRIAELCGYESYPAYAYENEFLRDYSPEKAKDFYDLVKEEILPLYTLYSDRFDQGVEKLSQSKLQQVRAFLYDDYDSGNVENPVLNYALSTETGLSEVVENFFTKNVSVFVDDTNATEGAFTAFLYDYGFPVCFFGPGYQSCMTVAHELGHFYSMLCNWQVSSMIDLAEVHSQANELLFLEYMRDQMDEKAYTVLVDYTMYSIMYQIILFCIIDEFEQIAYAEEPKTADEMQACMERVCGEYGLQAEDEIWVTAMDYWKRVVIETPMYYISYAVSAVASLGIYAAALEDFDAGVEIYCTLVEEVDIEAGFCAALTEAGLGTPFEKKTYEKLRSAFGEKS